MFYYYAFVGMQKVIDLYVNSCTCPPSEHLYVSTGVVEISPSPVVCQAGNQQTGDQLELMCNTTSTLEHRWEFTVFPENVSYTRSPVSSIGVSGITTAPLIIGTSMITFSRLSGPNVQPLVSMITINPVSRGLNGTVVNCFELDTNLVATTTIQIIYIDSQQFGKTPGMYIYVQGYNGDCPNPRSMIIHLAYN